MAYTRPVVEPRGGLRFEDIQPGQAFIYLSTMDVAKYGYGDTVNVFVKIGGTRAMAFGDTSPMKVTPKTRVQLLDFGSQPLDVRK